MEERQPIKREGFRHFYSLLLKNLRIFARNRGLVAITFLSPIILMGIFIATFQIYVGPTSSVGLPYNIAFQNADIEGLVGPGPYLNSGGRASVDFIDAASNLSLFTVHSKYDGRPITQAYGTELLNEGKLDAVIFLPKNFSELVFGSTWWYRVLKLRNFENISEILNGTGVDESLGEMVLNTVNGTDYPVGLQPNFTIGLTPNPIDGALLTSVLLQIVDKLLLSYNALNMSSVETFIRNGINHTQINVFDYFMAKYIIIAGLMPISAVATIIVNEKEEGSLSLVDRTFTSRGINLLSLTASQLIVSGIQIVLLMGLLWISGAYIHPGVNWGLILLTCSTLAFVSISIGLVLGLTTKNSATSGVIAFIILIIFQLLGGTFFQVNPALSAWIPTYYCTQASLFTIIEGAGWDLVGWYLLPPALMGLVIFLIANLAFKLKKQF